MPAAIDRARPQPARSCSARAARRSRSSSSGSSCATGRSTRRCGASMNRHLRVARGARHRRGESASISGRRCSARARPTACSAAELELAERIIAELAPASRWPRRPRPGCSTGSTSASRWRRRASRKRAAAAAPGLRCFGPGAALRDAARLIERLQAKRGCRRARARPSTTRKVLGVMRHLALYWAPEPPERKHTRHSVKSRLTVAHGFDGVLEALGGDGRLARLRRARAPARAGRWRTSAPAASARSCRRRRANGSRSARWSRCSPTAAQLDGRHGAARDQGCQGQETRVGIETLSRSAGAIAVRAEERGRRTACCLPGGAAAARPRSRCAPASIRGREPRVQRRRPAARLHAAGRRRARRRLRDRALQGNDQRIVARKPEMSPISSRAHRVRHRVLLPVTW